MKGIFQFSLMALSTKASISASSLKPTKEFICSPFLKAITEGTASTPWSTANSVKLSMFTLAKITFPEYLEIFDSNLGANNLQGPHQL